MKLISNLFLFFLACAGAFLASASGQSFSVTLHAPAEPVKAGSEVRLRVTVTNTSDHDVLLVRSPGIVPDEELSYQIEIRDARGQVPPLTPFFQHLKDHPESTWGSYVSYTLGPGKSLQDDLLLTRLYVLSETGTYTISVARGIRPLGQNLKQDVVKSNTIALKVTK